MAEWGYDMCKRNKRKINGFIFGNPYWLEFGSFGKKEFKQRSNDQEKLIKDFMDFMNKKYQYDYRKFQEWLKT